MEELMSTVSDYKYLIIPLTCAAIGGFLEGVKNFASDMEITDASMAKLVSMSTHYKENMLFWSDVKPLALGATFVSATVLGAISSVAITRAAPHIRDRDWFILFTGVSIALVVSCIQWRSAMKNFENYQYLYDRCIQRLKIEFNYTPI